jgi:hypothetical protein
MWTCVSAGAPAAGAVQWRSLIERLCAACAVVPESTAARQCRKSAAAVSARTVLQAPQRCHDAGLLPLGGVVIDRRCARTGRIPAAVRARRLPPAHPPAFSPALLKPDCSSRLTSDSSLAPQGRPDASQHQHRRYPERRLKHWDVQRRSTCSGLGRNPLAVW